MPAAPARSPHQLVDVAPFPIFSGLERFHDRMTARLEVLRRMLVLRLIAAGDVSALQTFAKMQPRIACLQAILAAARARFDVADHVEVRALRHGKPSVEDADGRAWARRQRYPAVQTADRGRVGKKAREGERARGYFIRPSSRPTFLNAANALSRCDCSSAELICTRMRAVPSGTTGKPNPVTKTPSFNSMSLILIANAVSPTMIGMIALSPSSGLKPSEVSPARKYLMFCRCFASSPGFDSSSRIAARALEATVAGSAFEKSIGRDFWTSVSISALEPATKPPAAPPSALPSVPVMISIWPVSPWCSIVPRPVAPMTPVP